MKTIKILALLLVWYAIGVASFVYWWTKDFDLTSRQIPTAFMVGFTGVLAYPLGYIIHSNKDETVLIRKKGE